MVSTVDALATQAGIDMLRRGGSAVDAAVAANAVLTVTLPNQCGLGGDLFALISTPDGGVATMTAAGRAGSRATADGMRAEGHSRMPLEDPRSVTMPGCVDGWLAMHYRYGRLPIAEVLAQAIRYAEDGFPVSVFAAAAISKRARTSPDAAAMTIDGELHGGRMTTRPGAARVLRALATGGRRAVFEGEFGDGLLEIEGSPFTRDDLAVDQSAWTDAIHVDAFGGQLWTAAPPSQGYITLGAAVIAEHAGLGTDPESPEWAHLLIEAIRQASWDRPASLYDGADPAELLSETRLRARASAILPDRTTPLGDTYRPGGTTFLGVVDADGMAVSLIQSNCMSFGSGIVAGTTGIWLQNRGIGFSLEPGSPAELAPGRRPPHTLAPVMVTNPDGSVRAVVGTRGGDSQPQVVLQLLARILLSGQDPAEATAAGRWILRGTGDETSFDTWGYGGDVRVVLEGQVPGEWATGLRSRGHVIEEAAAFGHAFGHAQVIVSDRGVLFAAADPRSTSGSAAGY
jgi:gamma-glutamyltranspeptidase/glutathione hydrolase